MILRVKNWREFQHYKGRKPPWIRLYRDLLDNFEFHSLPVASRALAPCIWLLASEYDEGAIPWNPRAIAFRLRMDEASFHEALNPLIEAGFLARDDNASGALATCGQDALSESEAEAETDSEAEKTTAPQAVPADDGLRQPEADSGSRQPSPIEASDERPAPARRSSRGTRLPEDWLPSPDERAFAENLGLNADVVGEEFRDFWIGVPGARGCKLDWPATFRNRCRDVAGRKGSARSANGIGQPPGGGGVAAATARYIHRMGLDRPDG